MLPRTAALIFLLLYNAICTIYGFQQEINIGAFFYDDEIEIEREFRTVVDSINADENQHNFILRPIIKRLSADDNTVLLQEHACELIDNGVVAIFGPSSKAGSDIISLICNSTGIPHIEYDVADEGEQEEQHHHMMTLNVFPSQTILSKAYADILTNYGWRKFTLVYDGDDVKADARLQDLLQLREIHNAVVRVRKYRKDDDYRIMWKSIRSERRVVLDCTPENLVELLNSSAEFGLTGQFNHIFLTNLESYTDNLEELSADNETFANITAARLLLNSDHSTYAIGGYATQLEENISAESNDPERRLLYDLIHDGVHLFTNAWRNASYYYPERMRPPRMSCDLAADSGRGWQMGRYLMRLMKATSGVNNTMFRTSNLQFDDDGQRINFKIEIYDPLDGIGIAEWDTRGQITPINVEAKVQKKMVYRVATRMGPPYFDFNQTALALNLTGNAIYEGYAVDLIDAIAKEVGFDYVFVPVADNQYGNQDKETKQWNGIIGEIINNDAHMGICDLTITQARRTVVDFTVPFMQLGISILAYKEPHTIHSFAAYLAPFDYEVWIYIVVSILITSFLKVFIARIAKGDWLNPHPCNNEPEALENQWNLHNAVWLTIASITTAGCDILPASPQVRLFEATWWIFAIIIANSYTANLAAFLTKSNLEGSITNLKGLSGQSSVKFGTILGGSTYNLLSESNETVYRLAFNAMNKFGPSVYMKSNDQGVEHVKRQNGTYMFLMETTTLEYNRQKFCNLRAVGEKFGEKHYAIAVPFNAEYRSNLSVAILHMSERGQLYDLKQKWWKKNSANCSVEKDSTETPDMNFEEVRGIFYTLYVGILVAYFIGIIEFVLYCHTVAVEEQLSLKMAMIKELRFVLCIWNNRKPIMSGSATNSQRSFTSHRSIAEKSLEQTPKSARRIVLGRSSEEMRELPAIPAASSSSSSTTTNNHHDHEENEAQV